MKAAIVLAGVISSVAHPSVAHALDPVPGTLEEGKRLQRAGDFNGAAAQYLACLSANPDDVDCHWELGWSYWSLGNWDLVVAEWERVQALDAEHAGLDRWLAEARANRDTAARIRQVAKDAPHVTLPPPPSGQTIRIRAVGDIMLGSDYPDSTGLPPDDGLHSLDAVAPLLQNADLTFGNLEGPLCDSGTTDKCSPGSNCYAFRCPTRYGTLLQNAGFDVVSTANNHAGDFGDTCRRETEATLDSLGIAWSGAPGTIATIERDALRIALVAFHTSPLVNNVNDYEAATALVKLAASSHHLVIVSFHGGAEGSSALHVPDAQEMFYGENRGYLREFVRVVIDAGADLVLGHGPHVPRGLEVIDGHLVAYSLGNFATYGKFNLSGNMGTSLILEATLDADGRFVQGRILPMRQPGKGIPEPDPNGAAIGLIRMLSLDDFPETAPIIGEDGAVLAP